MLKFVLNNTICIFLMLLLIGALVYGNVLFNQFIFDDQIQIIKSPVVHTPIDIPLFFISSIRNIEVKSVFLNFSYRPLMFSAFSLLYPIGRGSTFPFHLFQVSLFILNAFLVFILFKSFFSKPLAFFLSIIFLIHPLNEEVAAYIANTQDVLFFFFGVLALITLRYNLCLSIWKKGLLSMLLLFALLSKETAIVFCCITLFYILLFKQKEVFGYWIPFISTMILYGILRISASQFYFISIVTPSLMKTSLSQRIFFLPKIHIFYLHELFIPNGSFIGSLTLPRSAAFWSSLSLLSLFYMGICLLGVMLWKKKKNEYLFFLAWFLIGIGFHLQVFPLEAVVEKRWFYFPMVGFLGMVGLGIASLGIQSKTIKIVGVSMGILFLLFCLWNTVQRNTYWRDYRIIHTHMESF